MTHDEIRLALTESFADGHLSNEERTELKLLAARLQDRPDLLNFARNRAFEIAREAVTGEPDLAALVWLQRTVTALAPPLDSTPPARVAFSRKGEDACRPLALGELCAARDRLDVCLYTITDNHLADALLAAHERGVTVRIITDDEKVQARGSDLERLADCGVPIRCDDCEGYMHHKFAVIDHARVLTGSYNWTRGAADWNFENLLLLAEPPLVAAFEAEFEALWALMTPLRP